MGVKQAILEKSLISNLEALYYKRAYAAVRLSFFGKERGGGGEKVNEARARAGKVMTDILWVVV